MKYIYIDESRISKSRFQLFGSFWINRDNSGDFEKEYWKLWDKEFPTRRSELHWVKVSKGKLETYKKFIDLFATYPGTDFRCVLLDTRTLDYKKYHNGDKELGFYKFLYFFISRNIEKDFKFKGIKDKYKLILDRRRRQIGD